MRNIFRNLFGETICNIFTTRYCAATDGVKDSSFSFVKSVVIEMILYEVLDKTLNHSLNRWSQSEIFMQVLFEKIINDPSLIALIVSFSSKAWSTRSRKSSFESQQWRWDFLTTRSIPMSLRFRLKNNSKARRSRRRRKDQNYWRRCNSSMESYDKR